jgi:hypothetical protein
VLERSSNVARSPSFVNLAILAPTNSLGSRIWPGGQVGARQSHSPASRYSSAVTDPQTETPSSVRAVQYKGEPLDAERGPGLGCFRFQLILLAILIVLTPLSAVWGWPAIVTAGLMIVTIGLLLVAGQTIIFLLRLVAADRRAGPRRPLGSATKTVGEIEEPASAEAAQPQTEAHGQQPGTPGDEGAVRQ